MNNQVRHIFSGEFMYSRFKSIIDNVSHLLGIELKRYKPDFLPGCVSLSPVGPSIGNVLIAYILAPFLRRPGEHVSTSHTHHVESKLMAQAWLDKGYSVDVIDYRNDKYIPIKDYQYFVSARTQLDTIASRLNSDCTIIAHFDTSHYSFNNYSGYERLLALQKRRGISLPHSIRLIEQNRALENADIGVVLGNQVTLDTYRFAGKPLLPLSVTSTVDYPWAAGKNFDSCRNNFLWFGSGSLVHKGLDITLEAFVKMPKMHLTVCGPIDSEPDFRNAYYKELYETENISAVGWVDVSGEVFRNIASNCNAVIHPSCAEGQATSVINCMHAGLIPIVSKETGLSVNGSGFLLNSLTIEEICKAVPHVASLPKDDLGNLSRNAWECATSRHSHHAYSAAYGKIIEEIISMRL